MYYHAFIHIDQDATRDLYFDRFGEDEEAVARYYAELKCNNKLNLLCEYDEDCDFFDVYSYIQADDLYRKTCNERYIADIEQKMGRDFPCIEILTPEEALSLAEDLAYFFPEHKKFNRFLIPWLRTSANKFFLA